MKKVRPTEEDICYEELAVIENFNENEIMFELKHQLNKEKHIKFALQDYRLVEE